MTNYHEKNRHSWNEATKQHHSHKPDLIEQYKNGRNNLYPEETALLSDVRGKSLVHLQCNDGQDTLSIAKHLGANVLGVDISDEAIDFARKMSTDANIPAEFIRADIFDWFDENDMLYDVVYTGYGAINWISDIDRWANGIAKTLKPNGRFSMIEFHPILMMLEDDWSLKYDYMGGKPYSLGGVGDYVGDDYEGNFKNPHPSYEFAWGIADVVMALLDAGLTLNLLQEYPYVNGWKPFPDMRTGDDYRNYPPENLPSLALMFSIVATKNEYFMNQAPQDETPAETLARSAFGFAFFALIPAIITWIFFWLAPPSPSPTFRLIRWAIIGGFALILLFVLWMTRYFYRTPPEKLQPQSQALTTFFGQTWLAIITIFLLIEVNIIAFLLLRGIAPSITNPTKFLIFCWSLLLFGIIFLANRDKFQAWYEKTQRLWVSLGFVVVGIVVLGGLLFVNRWLINLSGANDILRGGLDYRQLEFYDDGNPLPSASEFWAEQSQTSVRWSPYSYWVMSEFDGDFINIASDGIRHTPNYDGELDIFMFGGSTVWGEGARDEYTIPAHLARLLSENNKPQNVVNYGQTGYVSSQDLIWFQRQLTRDNIPDIALFYQGFNDILSAWGTGLIGVTLQEDMRLNDSEAGRQLRAGQPVLQLPNQSLDAYDMSSAGVISATPEVIAEFWLANVEMLTSIASAYEVEVLFVWQPAIIFKDTLSESEQAIYQRSDNERAGLFTLYSEVDAIVRDRVATGDYDNIIILSDLFAENTEPIFHDLVHITEIGNGIVAEAILPHLEAILEN